MIDREKYAANAPCPIRGRQATLPHSALTEHDTKYKIHKVQTCQTTATTMPWLRKTDPAPTTPVKATPSSCAEDVFLVHVPRCGGTSLTRAWNVAKRACAGKNLAHAFCLAYFRYRYWLYEHQAMPLVSVENFFSLLMISVGVVLWFETDTPAPFVIWCVAFILVQQSSQCSECSLYYSLTWTPYTSYVCHKTQERCVRTDLLHNLRFHAVRMPSECLLPIYPARGRSYVFREPRCLRCQ